MMMMMTPEEHVNSLARVVVKAVKDNEKLTKQITILTEALVEAVSTCEACDGIGSYYVGGEIRGHIVCARCQKCRMVLAAVRGEQ